MRFFREDHHGRIVRARQAEQDMQRLVVPVKVADGLTTDVVRSLDAAGVRVSDVTLRRASLDDVFFSLTGHPAETERSAA